MKKKITYQQKLLYTLIAGVLFSIVIYNLALSKTISLAIKNNELQQQISKNQDAPKQIEVVSQKIKRIEQLVGDKAYNKIDIHQVLLESVTGYVQQNGLILKDFPQPFVIAENGYITKTAQLTVEGDFIPLLKLIYFLENNYKVGKVIAVDFKTTKEIRTRKRKLNTTIYLQNVKAENHEKNT